MGDTTGETTGPVGRPGLLTGEATFVPPILNVTPIHGYFFTGEETGSADRAGGLTCDIEFRPTVLIIHESCHHLFMFTPS